MFCPNCGNQINEGDQFCKTCGRKISMETNFAPTESAVQDINVPNEGKNIVALVIGIIGAVVWFIPIIGLPIGIVALVLGIKGLKKTGKGRAIAAIVLGSICLVLTIINASIGAYQGFNGQLWFQKSASNVIEQDSDVTVNDVTTNEKDNIPLQWYKDKQYIGAETGWIFYVNEQGDYLQFGLRDKQIAIASKSDYEIIESDEYGKVIRYKYSESDNNDYLCTIDYFIEKDELIIGLFNDGNEYADVYTRFDGSNTNTDSSSNVENSNLNSDGGFLYDGACFERYETMGNGDIVYIADMDGLCVSFDDIYYIPLSYSEAKEGYDAYPEDDPESHIIITQTTVNGSPGIEIVSSGVYGKYFGEYIGIPDRDMWE